MRVEIALVKCGHYVQYCPASNGQVKPLCPVLSRWMASGDPGQPVIKHWLLFAELPRENYKYYALFWTLTREICHYFPHSFGFSSGRFDEWKNSFSVCRICVLQSFIRYLYEGIYEITHTMNPRRSDSSDFVVYFVVTVIYLIFKNIFYNRVGVLCTYITTVMKRR